MKFLKKTDHIKLLQLALGISIFAIGYLMTMFYFQMRELKEHKHQIFAYTNLISDISDLKLEIERDIYAIESQLLNENINSKTATINESFGNNWFRRTDANALLDEATLKNNIEINILIDKYLLTKNQILKNNKSSEVVSFNSVVNKLKATIALQVTNLEKQTVQCNANYEALIDNSKTSGFLIALISLVIFVLAYVKMNEDILKLKKINDELSFSNQVLSNAEIVAGFGSWKVNIDENKYIFSDNFYRLAGVEPKSFEPSLDKIVEFIHPEDREEVIKVHKESLISKQPTSIIYRYLLPDGTIKHIVTVGKFLHNSKGDLVKIGVNQDITALMKKSKELEEKNAKLLTINAELESFNNIVSHDLQEPLRKIQMFISRIESKDFLETSSEINISYFNKIKSAAQRMQHLMTDLVNYTRTIKADRIFEQVDLNEIFEEITEELSLSIEEKSAKITCDQLPTILGTRFQIQQLFINLVSNALKYVKPGVAPIIQIQLQEFDKETVNDKIISASDYHKITVTDNGIGFEQKHAGKIFMLFKRLETDDSYKGTGLGLAICKKIIDNNNGLITAVGIPGKGSIFSIYLPKHTNLN